MENALEKIAHVYGDVCIRRKRRKRQRLIVMELIIDYFQNSTLHGLRYIVERGLSIIERLFWLFTFVASFSICIILIYNTYIKWQTSPVIVTVNGRLASVGTSQIINASVIHIVKISTELTKIKVEARPWVSGNYKVKFFQVPFPAVTFCSQIKVKRSVYNFTEEMKKFEERNSSYLNHNESSEFDDDINKFENIIPGCDFSIGRYAKKISPHNYSNDMVEDITEVALTADEVFYFCKWQNKFANCTDLFHRVYTAEGVCYTSNNLAASDIFTDSIQNDYAYLESEDPVVGWSADTGEYTDYSIESPYPRRGRVYGTDPDMEIYLAIDPNQQNKECNTLYNGFKIFLHHPMDLPTSALHYYAALPGQTSSISIRFHQLNTDKNLLNSNTPAEIRQCYSQSERPLRYFKLYTASNCRAECLSNYTYSVCKCVAFYMPHDNSSEICSSKMSQCIINARDYMADRERGAELGFEDNDEACMCRPSCDSIEYDAEILKTEFHLAETFNIIFKKKSTDDDYNLSFAHVELFFKKPQFVTMQRRELFGVTDFLANIRGLLGLFLGFSIISLVEIFYFMTLRVGLKLKRDVKEEKQRKRNDKPVKKKE